MSFLTEKQGRERASAALRHLERGPRQFNPSGAQRIATAHQQARDRILGNLAGKLDPQARTEYERQLDRAGAEIEKAWNDAQQIENNAGLFPRHREQQIADRIAKADETIRDAVDTANAVVQVLKAEALTKALPQMPDDAHAQERARADALMILDRTPADRRGEKLRQMGQRDDAIGALVTSQWGSDYLGATHNGSGRTADKLHSLVVDGAVEAALSGTNPDRAEAAQAVRGLGELNGLADTAQVSWAQARAEITQPTFPAA